MYACCWAAECVVAPYFNAHQAVWAPLCRAACGAEKHGTLTHAAAGLRQDCLVCSDIQCQLGVLVVPALSLLH